MPRRIINAIAVALILFLLGAFLGWLALNVVQSKRLVGDPVGTFVALILGAALAPLFVYLLIRSTTEAFGRASPSRNESRLLPVARFALGGLGIGIILFAGLGIIGVWAEQKYGDLGLWGIMLIFGIGLASNLTRIGRRK
jgi:hypothetical protein